jgi:hypothetical protein
MAALQRLALRGTPKATKQAARYTPAGGAERCGMCRHYVPSNSCARIEGPVSAAGWCQLYSQQMTWRPRAGQDAGLNPGLVPQGVTLDLSFMAPGSLDTRITFTRASTGTYFDSTGTMRTAAINAPRWDYDPVTHALRGMLIEEARTNLLPTSVDFSGAGWTVNGITSTAASGIAPDGATSMTRLAETAASGFHFLTNSLTLVASTAYTVSVFVKASQDRYFGITLDNVGSDGGYATFDVQAGVVTQPATALGAGVVGGASIQGIGGGVYRCKLTTTIGASTSGRLILTLSNAPTAGGPYPSYPGNTANGLLIWGAQVEAGAFPTSYIGTTSVAITRAIDRCFIPAANMTPWFASPGGSWFADINYFNPAPSNARVLSRGNNGNVTNLFISPSLNFSQYDGAAIVATANITSANTVAKACSTWAPGLAKMCLNAGPVVTSATLTTGYAVLVTDGVSIMTPSATPSTDNSSGYVRRVSYWPRALTNAEMQSVTT